LRHASAFLFWQSTFVLNESNGVKVGVPETRVFAMIRLFRHDETSLFLLSRADFLLVGEGGDSSRFQPPLLPPPPEKRGLSNQLPPLFPPFPPSSPYRPPSPPVPLQRRKLLPRGRGGKVERGAFFRGKRRGGSFGLENLQELGWER
jgi:hypothetical protein